MIHFVDKNNKYSGISILYSTNDFYPVLYGKRDYKISARGNTPIANQTLAMVVSDITGTKRTLAEIESYKNSINNKKNVSKEYGFDDSRTLRFGTKIYLNGFAHEGGEFTYFYFPDKTRNED